MKFLGLAGDNILIGATHAQRSELVKSIDATIEQERSDITAPAGTGFEQLANIRDRIAARIGQDGPLAISRQDMIILSNLADAWRMYGFDQTVPENYAKFPVSHRTVEQISTLYDAVFPFPEVPETKTAEKH